MSQAEFTKLFTYMESRFAKSENSMEANFERLNSKLDLIEARLVAILNKNENYRQEQALININKVKRIIT